VASVGVREASFGRSSGATKTVRSAAKAIGRLQARIPLTLRGVRIVLRASASVAATSGNTKLSWQRRLRRWLRGAAWAAWAAARRAVLWLVPALQSVPSRLLAGVAVQCACALLSVVPVRFKDVQITHQVIMHSPIQALC
jgi:hypothetical protein